MMRSYAVTVLLAAGMLFALPSIVCQTVLYIGGLLFLVPPMSALVNKLMPKPKISPRGKAVFISGCDTGFGYMLAQRLDDMGFHVFAGCLFPDGEGAQNLKSRSSRVHVIGLDVTNEDSVEAAGKYVRDNLGNNGLWAVVNNAGIGTSSDLLWTSTETFHKVFAVNTIGVVNLTKALIPMIIKAKGRVITVGSLAARCSLPGTIPYSMSKAAAISFSEGLRHEVYKWGIPVITIEPGLHRTAILSKESIVRYIKSEWDTASDDVKEMYNSSAKEMQNSSYIDQYIKKTILRVRSMSNDPKNVISAMLEAVTAVTPEYHYRPANLTSKILVWLQRVVPDQISVPVTCRVMS